MAGKPKKLRCAYKYCRHQTHDIEPGTEIERSGKLYHPDCLHEQETIEQIIDVFYKQVNPDVVFWQLRKVINKLVYEEGFEAEYILFAIRRHLEQGKPLTYPAGIAYIVQNRQMKAAFEAQRHSTIQVKPVLSGESPEQTFEYRPAPKRTLDSLFQ